MSRFKLRQLSKVNQSTPLSGFVWSVTGKQIAALSDKQLLLFDTQGQLDVVELGLPAFKLYQWTNNDLLLMSVIGSDGPEVVSYDVKNGQFSTLYRGAVRWAQLYHEQLFVTERTLVIQRVKEGQLVSVPALEDVLTNSEFHVKSKAMYFLNINKDVLRYNVENEELKMLSHYPNASIALSDVSASGNKLLISKHVSAKKEIVLLQSAK